MWDPFRSVPGMVDVDGADVRLLFGPGGFIRVNRPGRFDVPASAVDITGIAEDFCRAGIRLPRAVPAPAGVTGDVEGDLGEGGRAIWVDGGGDIALAEVLWAIAAALEQVPVAEVFAIADARQRSANRLVFAAVEAALQQAGLSRRQVNALLRQPRRALGGRAAVEVFDDVPARPGEIGRVIDLVVGRVRDAAGTGAVVAFLETLADDPAMSGPRI